MCLTTHFDFESQPAKEQNLSFSDSSWEFDLKGVFFNPTASPFCTPEGSYTALALLLSDQCPFSVRIVRFDDTCRYRVTEERVFGGSLLRQINDVRDYVDMLVADSTNVTYPENALHEVILNAILHRDYTLSADIFIKLYPDQLEILSPGGLCEGLTGEDMAMGLSVCRNPQLFEIFKQLKLTTGCGVGHRILLDAYRSLNTPTITCSPRAVRVTMPHANKEVPPLAKAPAAPVKEAPAVPEKTDTVTPYTSEDETVLRMVRASGSITRQDVEKAFGTSPSTASRLLRRMAEAGILKPIGSARSTKYILA